MISERQIQDETYESLATKVLPSLLFTSDNDLPQEIYLLSFADTYDKLTCQIVAASMKEGNYF